MHEPLERVKDFVPNLHDIKVLTPDGWSDFAGVTVTRDSEPLIELTTESGRLLQCTSDHPISVDDGIYTKAELLEIGHHVWLGGETFEAIVSKEVLGSEIVYDLIDVEASNRYFVDGVVVKNCEFLGSDMTLIAGDVLQRLTWKEPIYDRNGFKFYEEADRSHSYVMVVDTARGTGLDYSAFIVFDTSSAPYKVVATFRDNNMSAIVFPKYIMEAATYFNNCHILIETNDLGQQVVDILHHEMEYENLVSTVSKMIGHEATGGFGTKSSIGVRTSKSVKRLGCATFKSMVESNQLLVADFNLIDEMARFALKKGSYEASVGNDDLVMCAVLFSWLTTQPYFKELTGTDIVRSIYDSSTGEMEWLVPFGIIDTGHEQADKSDGDLWSPTDW